LRGKRSRKAVA